MFILFRNYIKIFSEHKVKFKNCKKNNISEQRRVGLTLNS